jgi:hypothetical protein
MSQRCTAGVCVPEVCGAAAVVGSGDLPRLTADGDHFVAAWRAGAHVVLQRLGANGAPAGASVTQATTRPALLLDVARYQGGLGLAWVESRPTSPTYGPTSSYARTYSTDLVAQGSPQLLPTSGSNWDQSEELRVAAVGGGASFIVAERIFTDSPGYGQRYRFGLFPAASPASHEFDFVGTGSQSQGAEPRISVADLPAGFALSWLTRKDPSYNTPIAGFDAAGAQLWRVPTVYQFAIGKAQSVTYDGTDLLSLHHWGSWRNRSFDPANGSAGSLLTTLAYLDWPRASNAAYVGPYHLQLLENSDGDLYTARFDATGALLGPPTLIVNRAGGDCSGQCARVAVTATTIGLLYADGGTIAFLALCR